MKSKAPFRSGIILVLALAVAASANINITYFINTELDRAPISPYIYGSNSSLGNDENLAARRSGGNRLTGYNWENNYSNAGSDWYQNSDQYLVRNLPSDQRLIPGIVLTRFHDSCLAADQLSLITLQMAGYVAADDDGTVEQSQTAPSVRWKEVVYAKGTPFCSPSGNPDTADDYVYMDECVNFLVERYGGAIAPTGVKAYSLDNEPGLWPSTHPRIHPDKTGCQELVDRTIAMSKPIKDIDPHAQIFGPALYGFGAYLDLQGADDWDSLKEPYSWFIDYYLYRMARAYNSPRTGKRLLDVLDLHWYPEARGDGARITESASYYTRANAEARMQAPRTLWDPDYVEDSWIGTWFRQYLPLLPHVIDSIDTYYPGTKLAITEFTYGAPDHFSGGAAMADALGIFGKYGLYMSAYWGSDGDYVSAAYKVYRNYDGGNSTFGDTKVYSSMTDKVNSSVYASIFDGNDAELHIIAMNKSFDSAISGTFDITSAQTFTTARVWAFDDSSPQITEIAPVTDIVDNSFCYTIEPLTVCHIVLHAKCSDTDLNGDCQLDYRDLEILASQWLTAGACPGAGCADFVDDDYVDFMDFAHFSAEW